MTAHLVGTKTGRYVVAGLRKAFRYWPPKAEIRRRAHKGPSGMYMCQECGGYYERKETHVDHIIPVVGPTGIDSWDTYITRLFCPVENLRVVCKPCHKRKTNAENKERRSIKVRLKQGRLIADKLRTGRRIGPGADVWGKKVCKG